MTDYAMVPNSILEAMYSNDRILSQRELRVMVAVIHSLYGFRHRKVSIKTISDMTEINPYYTKRAIDCLVARGFIFHEVTE